MYYMTTMRVQARNEWTENSAGVTGCYSSHSEVLQAYAAGHLETHSSVNVVFPEGMVVQVAHGEKPRALKKDTMIETTPGRLIVNDSMKECMPFYNFILNKHAIRDLIHDCHDYCGRPATLELLDELKALGYKGATRSGLSIVKDDMRIPAEKWDIIAATQKEVDQTRQDFLDGLLTDNERNSKVIDLWTTARDEVSNCLLEEL